MLRRSTLETAFAPTTIRKPNTPPPQAATEILPPATEVSAAPELEIPGYILRQLLGRGGMGEVWRAEQTSLGRQVAIKVLPPRLAKDPEFVARFDKEATALASLSHPHIVQIIDRGRAGEHYYFVMEFVEGATLRERMSRGLLRPTEVLRIGTQLCRAVQCAHERHIIHRDLKPENILLDERGHVKVADFGLVGFRSPQSSNDPRITSAAVAMGTLNYMAPEQRRDAGSVDERADLYSIGVILYELLTGELPLGRFRTPSERVPALDSRLDAVVMRALEADPAARYAQAAILGETLERLLAEATSAPERAAPVGAAKPRTLRHIARSAAWPAAWVLGLAIIAALGIGVARRIEAEGDDGHDHAGPGRWPGNTENVLNVGWTSLPEASGMNVVFEPGTLPLHAHAGRWSLRNGRLSATQAGDEGGLFRKLTPRAYLSDAEYRPVGFDAEVTSVVRALEADFPRGAQGERFAELSLRGDDLEFSVTASPQAVRVTWRYRDQQGHTEEGSSLSEKPFPGFGRRFRLGLSLTDAHAEKSFDLRAKLDGQVFFQQTLLTPQARVGVPAVGCRNLHCDFERLTVKGQQMK
jgi:serine/threonine-protein kinase